LHPVIRAEAINAIEVAESRFPANMAIRVVQGYRTFAEQDALFAKRPKVTNARGGQSYHNYGLAIDFAILHDKDGNGGYEELSWDIALDFDRDGVIDWQEVVTAFEAIGWKWGGKWRTFKDYPHVEKTFGYTFRQLLDKHNRHDFVPGTTYVNL
jgi:peptidoglycan L-alanyl-D-glutamate endopeptidase CwlK